MNYVHTTEKITCLDYPYGFKLRTTKSDWLEFDKKKGFRHVSMTVNPKTGKNNKPKRGIYRDIILLGMAEDTNHTVSKTFSFYSENDHDEICSFLSDTNHFLLFTEEQIEYIYIRLIAWYKTTIYAQSVYCGTDKKDLFPLFKNAVEIAVQGVKSKGVMNLFDKIHIDWKAVNALKVEGYQPFKVVSYGI